MIEKYLVEIHNGEGESETIRRIFKLPPFISEGFFRSLGITYPFSWYLLMTREHHLVGLMEVDIIAGQLNWKDSKTFKSLTFEMAKTHPELNSLEYSYYAALDLANSGGIKWPPLTDYIVGIEVKRAYLENTIRSKKSSERKRNEIRKQVEKLLNIGFNKVALLDTIVSPPASGINGQAFIKSAHRNVMLEDEMWPILKERLPVESPAGHYVWSIGSVVGGVETKRGTGCPTCLRIASENPFLQADSEKQSRRQELEKKLCSIFSKFSTPHEFPVIFIDCRTCGKIHREDACNKTPK